MSGGVGGFTVVGAFLAGVAVGVGAMGWHTGAWTTTGAAADKAQGQVNESVADAREIDGLDSKAAQSADRVRTVTRTVTVAAECPNGNGPVSDALNNELQSAFSQAATGTRARQVGSGSAAE